MQSSFANVLGTRVELIEVGKGLTMLFLNSGMSAEPATQTLQLLGERFRVLAPSHPGFGHSERPRELTTIDDLAYFYLDLLDVLDLRDVMLVGVSFGAWIAAEIAIKSTARLAGLVLANPIGIKVSDRETRDIGDIFAMTDEQLDEALYANAAPGARDYRSMPEEEALVAARSRESLARYGWSPYMHDPKLKGRLHRIGVPTMFLRGVEDGLTKVQYTSQFSLAVPGAQLELINGAGHLPHIEQPKIFAKMVEEFFDRQLGLRTAEGKGS